MALTPYSGDYKFARINATADGDNTVVAATTGYKIRVLGYALTANAAGVISFKDATNTYASFELTDSGWAFYGGPTPAFDTISGGAIVVNNAAGVDALGHITYILVRA